MSKNLFSLETRVKNALVKQNIEKLLGKRKQNSFEKVYSTIKVGLEKSNVAVDDKLGFTINYYYNKHKQALLMKLIRSKKNPYVLKLEESYPNLEVIKAVQYLLLKEMISTKKKSDIEIIDNFIKILTKNKTIVPNDFEVDEL
jgi:hypothetical protein